MGLLDAMKAWMIAVNPNEEEQMIAQHRLLICNTCPSKTFAQHLQLYYCDKCNCPISGKIFATSKESCPLKKWDK